jgi:hypothetical protein
MDDVLLAVQVLLLILMITAWWGARRDLLNIAETQQTPTLEKIEAIRTSIDQLLDQLDSKVEFIESRIRSIPDAVSEAGRARKPSKVDRTTNIVTATNVDDAPVLDVTPVEQSMLVNEKYKDVYALADSGITIQEIAHRTGLGLSEVEMVVNLRP